jgi:hypothetical protein
VSFSVTMYTTINTSTVESLIPLHGAIFDLGPGRR